MERNFVVSVDLEELGKNFKEKDIDVVKSYSVVESFVDAFDPVHEVFHMVCFSSYDNSFLNVDDNDNNHLIFSKTVFSVADNGDFKTVVPRMNISRDDYYHILLDFLPAIIENKMVLVFSYHDVQFTLHTYQDFAVLHLESSIKNIIDDNYIFSIFDGFSGLSLQCFSDRTTEELFYYHYKKI